MNVQFGPRGRLMIDDARIKFPNFAGAKKIYNDEGKRNFLVVIPDQEMADALMDKGWNVSIKPAREEGDTPYMHLKVNVSYRYGGPKVYLVSGDKITTLDEDTISMLDRIDISSVDMDIIPSKWSRPDGSSGQSAYLQAMRVYQEVDRFASSFNSPAFGEDDGYPFE